MDKVTKRRLIIAVVSFIVGFLLVQVIVHASAEEYEIRCWVLCQPDSYVNVREFAKKSDNEIGIMECGDAAYTDGRTKRGFLYLCGVNNELGYGWIHKGYVVYSEPVIITLETNIYADGRVACWRSIGGTRRCWAQPGDVIRVYAVSDEWSITNKGFVKTQYLGVNYDLLLGRMETGESDTESTELHWEDDEGTFRTTAIQR